MKIKDLFNVHKALTTSREFFNNDNGIMCVHYGDIYKNYSFKTINSSNIINKFSLPVDQEKLICTDSLIMPDVTETITDFGHITYIRYNDYPYINGTHTFALTAKGNDKNKLKYIYYYLQSPKNRKLIQSYLLGSTVFQLSKKDLENFELIDLHNEDEQRHIVDIIGSIDDKIENNNKIITKSYEVLDLKMKKFMIGRPKKIISNFKEIEIIGSGIDKFDREKIYLDTSCVAGNSIIDTNYNVSYNERPSRANMQPIINSVWFAKLKNSPKHIIVKDYSKKILNNYVFSTGFMGIKISKEKFNLLALYFISDIFDKEKDSLSIGATMQSINNNTFKNMYIPEFVENDYKEFNYFSKDILKTIYLLELENSKLQELKSNYLAKFF